ncbi:Hypothetical predicted protein, partial [Pelobates cultripes]
TRGPEGLQTRRPGHEPYLKWRRSDPAGSHRYLRLPGGCHLHKPCESDLIDNPPGMLGRPAQKAHHLHNGTATPNCQTARRRHQTAGGKQLRQNQGDLPTFSSHKAELGQTGLEEPA